MIATAETDLETASELPEEFYDVAQICKMLAEPSRLRVVFFLMNESELNVGVICGRLKQSQPAVSHHLALLEADCLRLDNFLLTYAPQSA